MIDYIEVPRCSMLQFYHWSQTDRQKKTVRRRYKWTSARTKTDATDIKGINQSRSYHYSVSSHKISIFNYILKAYLLQLNLFHYKELSTQDFVWYWCSVFEWAQNDFSWFRNMNCFTRHFLALLWRMQGTTDWCDHYLRNFETCHVCSWSMSKLESWKISCRSS